MATPMLPLGVAIHALLYVMLPVAMVSVSAAMVLLRRAVVALAPGDELSRRLES